MQVSDKFVIGPLDRNHDRAAFCCGNEALDRYLKQQAGQDARKNVAAPYVLVEPGSNIVLAYYTISMTAIDLGKLPESITRKLPKYPIVPAVLLGRLAVDRSRRGSGIGRLLLANALKRSLRNDIAWAVVVVDAIDEQARAFYMHHGFKPIPDFPMRLFIDRTTVGQMFPAEAKRLL